MRVRRVGRGRQTPPQGVSRRLLAGAAILVMAVLALSATAAASLDTFDSLDTKRQHLGEATKQQAKLTTATAAASTEDLPKSALVQGSAYPSLWFKERDDDVLDHWSYSALAPGQDEGRTREADPDPAGYVIGQWEWRLPKTSDHWTFKKGQDWEAVLYIEGLDEALEPVSDPHLHQVTGYQHRLHLTVQDRGDTIAQGSLGLGSDELEPGIQQLQVPVKADETHRVTPAGEDQLILLIELHSQGENRDAPVLLHHSGTDTPSRLVIPGYPVHALKAIEDPGEASDACSGCEAEQSRIQQDTDPITRRQGQDQPGGAPQEDDAATAGGALEPQDAEPGEADDEPSLPSSTGIWAVLAWTLFVASAGTYRRSERNEDRPSTPAARTDRIKQVGSRRHRNGP